VEQIIEHMGGWWMMDGWKGGVEYMIGEEKVDG